MRIIALLLNGKDYRRISRDFFRGRKRKFNETEPARLGDDNGDG